MAELSDGLESLENQFHLPPDTIPFEDFSGRKQIFGIVRKYDHVFCIFQSFRLYRTAFLLCVSIKFFIGNIYRLVAFSDGAKPSFNDCGVTIGNQNLPISYGSRILQRRDIFQQSKLSAILIQDWK